MQCMRGREILRSRLLILRIVRDRNVLAHGRVFIVRVMLNWPSAVKPGFDELRELQPGVFRGGHRHAVLPKLPRGELLRHRWRRRARRVPRGHLLLGIVHGLRRLRQRLVPTVGGRLELHFVRCGHLLSRGVASNRYYSWCFDSAA